MKKLFFILVITVIAFACGNQDSNKTTGADTTATQSTTPEPAAPKAAEDVTENPDYQKGIELIAKSDCLTCHKVEEKATGPAYRDVANKYSNDEQTITMLAEKVKKGGKGVWGEIPMAAHPALSDADAKQMVKYILLLKNK